MSSSSRGYGDHIGYLPGINDVIICPYNTSHVVGTSRMQRHLISCRQKNPEKAASITICSYNQSHHVPADDMTAHLSICRDFLAHKFQNLIRTTPRPKVEEPEELKEKHRSDHEEIRHQMRKMEHQAAYFEDADDGLDDVSLSGFSISDSVFEEPQAPPIPESVAIQRSVDGEIWIEHMGEGYQGPGQSNKATEIHVPAPHIKLPECDQEEIDNWT